MKLLRLLRLFASIGCIVVFACGSDPVGPINPPKSQLVVNWEHPFPPAIVTEVRGLANDDVYAVGGGGLILHYDGKTWATVAGPTREGLSGMCTVDDQIVAVGARGTILRFDGQWQTENAGTTAYLRSVWGSSPDTLYAVGDGGTVLRYEGGQWHQTSAPPSPWLTCIWGAAGNNLYVGAIDSLYHFDGEAWTNTNVLLRDSVWSIWGSSRRDIWVSEGTNWLWHYDGNTWTTVIARVSYPFTHLWGFAADDIVGVGTGGFVSRFDGMSWSEKSIGDYFLLSHWGVAADDLWIGGFTGTRSVSGVLFHFDGVDATQVGELLSDALRSVWTDPNGEHAIAVGFDGAIMQKEDNTWVVVDPVTSENLTAVWKAPNADAIAVGDNGTCLKRQGQVWTSIDVGTTSNLVDVWGSSNSDIYLASGEGLWHFDGFSWGKRGTLDRAHSLWGTDASNVFVAGMDSISGVIQRSSGVGWNTIYSSAGTYVSQLTGYADGRIFAVFHDGGLQSAYLKKYDNNLWTDVTPPQVNQFDTIAACENFGLVAVGHNLESGGAHVDESVLRLHGGEWKPLDTVYSALFDGAHGFDGGVYLVGGASIVRCHD